MPATKSMSGLLIIDKPAGLTSHDVVARIRRLLAGIASPQPRSVSQNPSSPPLIRGESVVDPPDKGDNRGFYRQASDSKNSFRTLSQAKVGHTGTLDPFATGVLLVAIGSATRLIEYSHAWDKEYEATFTLGASSDSDDVTGKISKTQTFPKPKQISKLQITNALRPFIGTIKQTPPSYSAKKIMGERAYKLARRGIESSLQPRAVTIYDLRLTVYAYPDLSLTLTCSTGTYVRSLARDLGIALDTGAYVKQLRRTRIGPHKITDSVKLNQLNLAIIKDRLLPPEALISHLPKIILSDANVAQFLKGQTIGEQGIVDKTLKQSTNLLPRTLSLPTPPPPQNKKHLYAIYDQSSTLLGIALLDPVAHLLHPKRVFTLN